MTGIPNDDDIRALCEELERRGFRLDEPLSVLALAQSVPELLDWTDDLCKKLGTAEARADALATQLAHVRAVTAEVARQIECYVLADCQPEPPLFKWETMLEQLAGDAPEGAAVTGVPTVGQVLAVVKAVPELLDEVVELRKKLKAAETKLDQAREVVDRQVERKAQCRDSADCACSTKDCYYCGYDHNCTHTPLTTLATILAKETTG